MAEREQTGASGLRAPLFLVGALAALALALVVADLVRGERVPSGVTVEGIELAGQAREEAAATVRAEVGEPARRAIAVERGDEEFKLDSASSGVRVDADGTADAALAESSAPPGVRLVGDLLGLRSSEVDLSPEIEFNRDAVESFADQVAEPIDREPRDASLEVEASGLEVTASRRGLEVQRDELVARLGAALRDPERRSVEVPVERSAPEVDEDALAERHPHYLIVDRDNFRLRHYEGLEERETYRVSVGDAGQATPGGEYEISNKAENPTWYVPEDADWAGDLAGEEIPPGPDNPIKARWLGIEDGIGIHGTDETDSIGERASAGCIRMLIGEVRELYARVPVGTPVLIA